MFQDNYSFSDIVPGAHWVHETRVVINLMLKASN